MTLHDHIFVQCHFIYTNMSRPYGCAILAGGAGKRMGCVNKADLEYSGKSFAESIMAEMSKTGMPCYLSTACYEQNAPADWKTVADTVTDPRGGYIGPMGGIYSCLLQARADGLDGLFFAPCDVPLYNAEAIEKLADHISPETDAVIWKTGDGRLQMTFAYYSVGLVPTLEALISAGRYSMKACLDTTNVCIVDVRDAGIDEKIFVNINGPEDYRRLKTY